jgi:hypothetical protein
MYELPMRWICPGDIESVSCRKISVELIRNLAFYLLRVLIFGKRKFYCGKEELADTESTLELGSACRVNEVNLRQTTRNAATRGTER